MPPRHPFEDRIKGLFAELAAEVIEAGADAVLSVVHEKVDIVKGRVEVAQEKLRSRRRVRKTDR